MIHETENDIVFLTLIVGRKQKDIILEELSAFGGRLINVVYGTGSVKASYIQGIFGFVPEEHKALLTCLVPSKKVDDIFVMLDEKFDFNKPNTGIAFTIPIEKLSL